MRIFNVPSVGPRFWTGISIASVFGANLGDLVSHDLHLGHARGLPFEALAFALILLAKQRFRRRDDTCYWLGIVTLRTAATNLGDLLTHDLHVGYPAACAALGAAFLAVIVVGARFRPQAARPGSGVPPTSARYWLAIFLAGTLGTVGGDGLAGGLGLGVAGASVLLCAAVALLFAARRLPGADTGLLYWATILGIRLAGTTLGDLTAHHLGLDWSTAGSGLLLLGVLLAWPVAGAQARLPTPHSRQG